MNELLAFVVGALIGSFAVLVLQPAAIYLLHLLVSLVSVLWL